MPDPVSALAAGTVGSAVANIFGNQSGAKDIAAATDRATAARKEMFDTGVAGQKDYFNKGFDMLSPVAGQGKDVYNKLVAALPDLTAPIVMDQATLEKTPGYQFNVQQGNRSIDLSAISRGMSGAQAKAAAAFGVNTANTLYKDQFDLAYRNKEAAFNRLLQTAAVGTDAAKSIASNATSAGNALLTGATDVGAGQAGDIMTAGKAQAAANVNTGAQVGNALTGTAGLYANRNNINKLYA